MTAKETTLNELGEMLAHVVEHMATKDDLAAIRTELKADIAALTGRTATKDDLASFVAEVRQEFHNLHAEIRSIRVDRDDLMEKIENISGYRKEIDHAFERIAAIEQHLGIAKRNAA